jgi:phosphonate transport system permease protein
MISLQNITPEYVAAMKQRMPGAFGLSGKQRLYISLTLGSFLLLTVFSFWKFDMNPAIIFSGFSKFFRMTALFFPPSHGGWLNEFLFAMGETLAMAFLGTVFGFVLAFPLGFLAAKNIVKNPIIHNIFRRSFDVIRGINTLIWALMFVNVAGLGPFAGILAITITDMATMGKLFSEAIENVDTAQIEGATSTGASPLQIIRYAFVPQVVPVLLSNALYFFESNVRAASVLGILGAGGIGMQLYDRIRIMNWPQVCFIVIMIFITVAIIDTISKRIREAIIAKPDYNP